jgi:hypothetical protein
MKPHFKSSAVFSLNSFLLSLLSLSFEKSGIYFFPPAFILSYFSPIRVSKIKYKMHDY